MIERSRQTLHSIFQQAAVVQVGHLYITLVKSTLLVTSTACMIMIMIVPYVYTVAALECLLARKTPAGKPQHRPERPQ